MSDAERPCDKQDTRPVPDPRDAIIADLAARLDQSEQRCADLSRQLARQTEEIVQLSKDALQLHTIVPAVKQRSILRRVRQMFDRTRGKQCRGIDP